MSSLTFSLRVSACFAVLFAVFSLSCRSKSTEEAEANKSQPEPVKIEAEADVNVAELPPAEQITEEPAESIAVTVNGDDIFEDELQRLMKPQLDQMAKQNKQLPPAFAQAYRKQIRQQALETIIVRRLLEEKVKEANIVITEEEVINQLTKIAAAWRPPVSLEELKKKTAEYGQNFEEVKQQVRQGMAYQKIVEAQWAGKINITEEDAKKYYDENPTQFETPEQVRASHILIKPDTTDSEADPNQAKEKAKAKTQDLLKQIREGADFAELAKANSDCGSAAQGGDLNFFSRGKMVPPFEKAAFALEVGKVSDIVETRFGYHIIKVTDRKEASTTSFEQAKINIIRQLTQKKQSEFAQKYIELLKAEADIVYPPGKDPGALTNRP